MSPGRRLTRADWRQIAAGLAQALDYAAIGRRLGRPTSTVSREVARNGGPAAIARNWHSSRRPTLIGKAERPRQRGAATDGDRAPAAHALGLRQMCALQSSRSPAGWYVGELLSFTGQGLVKVTSAGGVRAGTVIRSRRGTRPHRHAASRRVASMIGDTFTMRNDLDQIEAALVGTPLAGLPIGHGPSGTVLVADIDPNRLHEAWQIADALAPVIGRLPVMVTDDFGDTLRIRPEPEPGPSESELRAFAEVAESSDPWLVYRHYSEDDEVDEGEVEDYARGMAGVDLDLTALVSDVALPAPRQALERALYDRLLADVDLYAQVLGNVRFVTQTDYWYTPNSVLLMLLPTSDVRSSGYWVDFFGAPTREYQRTLAEALAQWRHRWDARLVASWGGHHAAVPGGSSPGTG